jgi:HEAT repeat protein
MERHADVEGLRRVLMKRDLLKDTGGAFVDIAFARRLDAVGALGRLGDDDAVDALAHALHDIDPRVRAAALDAAGDAPHPAFLERLAAAAAGWRGDGLHALRGRALAILTCTRKPDLGALYAEALLDLTGDEEIDADDEDAVRRLLDADPSGAAPAAMAWRLIPEILGDERRREHAATLMVALGKDAVEPLLAALRDDELRPAATRVLGRLRDPRSVPLLTELLRNGDLADRVAAADALGDVRDPRTADDLLRAAFAEEVEARDAALGALDRLGSAGVVAAVTRALDSVGMERYAALRPPWSSGYGARAESLFVGPPVSASTASAASIQAVDHRANGVRTVPKRRT